MHELESLLATPDDDERALLQLEDSLTTGYAGALALESERMRLQRRLGELTNELAAGVADGRTHGELASVAQGLAAADERLDELRDVLASVRARASDLRAAVAAS